MKKNALFVAITIIAFAMSSCVVVHSHKTTRHDNGKHKGWYKHKNHPKKGTTIIIKDNDGKGNNKNNGKGNGKGKKK